MAILPDTAPDGDLDLAIVWRERFRPLEPLSAYATTFRYSLSPTPKVEELRTMLVTLTSLHDLARAELLAL